TRPDDEGAAGRYCHASRARGGALQGPCEALLRSCTAVAPPYGTCFSIRRMRCLVRTDVCADASCSGRTSPRLRASWTACPCRSWLSVLSAITSTSVRRVVVTRTPSYLFTLSTIF